jgi:predicted nucleic acid-binding Zn ribbon protein
MKSTCVICDSQYEKNSNKKTCSNECSKLLRKFYNKSYKDKVYEMANELGVQPYFITTYGYYFLKENPIVLDTLKISHLISGRVGVSNEVMAMRKNARITPAESNRNKHKWKVRRCKICDKDYIGIPPVKTCSTECSLILRKETQKKCWNKFYIKNKTKI